MNDHEKQDDAQTQARERGSSIGDSSSDVDSREASIIDHASIVHTAYADGRRRISFVNGLLDKVSAVVADRLDGQSLPMPCRRL
jgi:hypothetical protein